MLQRDKLLIGIAAVILLAGGIADSFVNRHLADSDALHDAAHRVAQLPQRIGAWTASEFELTKQEQRAGSLSAYTLRQYENEITGGRVEILLVCGPAGPISVHPPTACFRGTGYELIQAPVLTAVGADLTGSLIPDSLRSSDGESVQPSVSDDVMQMAVFRNPYQRGNESLRVFWGWGTDGRWSAPDDARFAFRGQPMLYKLYVTHRWDRQPGSHPPRVPERFMAEALPVIRAVLSGEQRDQTAAKASQAEVIR